MNDILVNGACDVFAQTLHEMYGYEVRHILSRTGRLIHAYCIDNGKCIDASGFYGDEESFIRRWVADRKYFKVAVCMQFDLEPWPYSDVYTEETFALAKKKACKFKI